MELLDKENINPQEQEKYVRCLLCDDDSVMLESEFFEHAVDDHPYRVAAIVKESLIIEKLSEAI